MFLFSSIASAADFQAVYVLPKGADFKFENLYILQADEYQEIGLSRESWNAFNALFPPLQKIIDKFQVHFKDKDAGALYEDVKEALQIKGEIKAQLHAFLGKAKADTIFLRYDSTTLRHIDRKLIQSLIDMVDDGMQVIAVGANLLSQDPNSRDGLEKLMSGVKQFQLNSIVQRQKASELLKLEARILGKNP